MPLHWRENFKKPSGEVLGMLKITSISLVRFTLKIKKILDGKLP